MLEYLKPKPKKGMGMEIKAGVVIVHDGKRFKVIGRCVGSDKWLLRREEFNLNIKGKSHMQSCKGPGTFIKMTIPEIAESIAEAIASRECRVYKHENTWILTRVRPMNHAVEREIPQVL